MLAHNGHNELECAASPVYVLLAPGLRCRAAVLSLAPAAGQGQPPGPAGEPQPLGPAASVAVILSCTCIFLKSNAVTNLAMFIHFEKPSPDASFDLQLQCDYVKLNLLCM